MAKQLRTEYSRLHIQGRDTRDMEQVLRDLIDVPAVDRIQIDDDVTYRIGEVSISRSGRYVSGNVFRVRDDDLPSVASPTGALRDLDIGDDEGLGEENAFYIDTDLNIVSYQANRFGVSLSRLIGMIGQLTELRGYFSADPILELNLLNRALGFERYTKLQIKLADLSDNPLGPTDGSIQGICDSARDFAAPYATFTLSMGHRGGSLRARQVKQWIRSLARGDGSQEVASFMISGKEPDKEKATVLDLIEETMKDYTRITPNRKRRYTYQARISAVAQSYANRLEEFEERYGRK